MSSKERLIAAFLALCAQATVGDSAVLAPPGAGPTRSLQLPDLWSIRTFDLVRISPDGNQILFALTPPETNAERELKIYHVASGETEVLRLGETYSSRHDARALAWTKSSDGLLFFQANESGITFWQWSQATKTSRPLFDHGPPSATTSLYAESPDGERIAFTCSGSAVKKHEEARRRALGTEGVVLGLKNGPTSGYLTPAEIWVWERRTGQQRQVYAGPWVLAMKWSPDSSKLAVQCRNSEKVAIKSLYSPAGQSSFNVELIDLSQPGIQKLRETELQEEWLLGWSPDGKSIAVDSQALVEVASSEVGTLGFELGLHMKEWRADSPDKRLRESDRMLIGENIGKPRVDTAQEAFSWRRDERIYFRTKNSNRSNLIAVGRAGGAAEPLSDPRWNLAEISYAVQAEVAAAVRSSANEPEELALIDLHSGAVRTLTSVNAATAALARPRMEPFSIFNRFGYETKNWLIRPAASKAGKRYPLVVLLYGFDDEFQGFPWMRCFAPFEYAKLGLCVLMANPPDYDGAPGEGRQTIPEKWRFGAAQNPLASLEATVDRLVSDGLVDPQRVAICGFSYGGFLAQYAVTHSSKFSVAFFADGGPYNPLKYYLEGIRDSANLITLDFLFGGPPFGRGGEAMRTFAPVYGIGQLAVPILYECHDGDEQLPYIADLYLTARQEGTPIEVVVYKDKHIMIDRRRQETSISRSTDWLRYWLLEERNPNPKDPDEYLRWATLRQKLERLKKGNR